MDKKKQRFVESAVSDANGRAPHALRDAAVFSYDTLRAGASSLPDPLVFIVALR